MIDPMKRVTIACLSSERQATVEELRHLGTVHVVPLAQPASEALDSLRKRQEQLARVISTLRSLKVPEEAKDCDREAVLTDAWDTMEDIKRAGEELRQASRAIVQLLPWGSFSRESIAALERRGLHVALCAAPVSRPPELPKGAVSREVARERGTSYFAVFSQKSLDDAHLPVVQLPQDTDLAGWQKRHAELEALQEKRHAHLKEIASKNLSALIGYSSVLEEKVLFAKARDGMSGAKNISFLRGYVPVESIDPVRLAARTNGWAIRYEDVPEDDTNVPTKLIIPRHFRMAKAIFDFVGILPGYREVDVSVSMLVFLSIFCAMLVGDAGYGLLFTVAVLWFRHKVTDPSKRQSMNLLLTMSLCILGYGALCGNWFAIPSNLMPFPLSGLPWLSESKVNQKHVQLLSFFLGAFHMSMARAWRAVLAARSINLRKDDTRAFLGKVREALGHIGWGVFLWANFGMTRLLIVEGKGVGDLEKPFVLLYIIGFVMILWFSINWKDMGSVIYMPFSFINCFVDVLSYIRLFAVGLSSLYIANSFNGMAESLLKLSPWTLPAVIIILALGHALNIALACMGILVHGIRLNTLEFSGHMDLSWSGKPYKPLTEHETSRG